MFKYTAPCNNDVIRIYLLHRQSFYIEGNNSNLSICILLNFQHTHTLQLITCISRFVTLKHTFYTSRGRLQTYNFDTSCNETKQREPANDVLRSCRNVYLKMQPLF